MGDVGLDLSMEDLALVRQILSKHISQARVWAYGSRVSGKNLKPFSDLDLVIKGACPTPFDTLANLRLAFEASDLPISVDLSDWASLPDHFKDVILEKHVAIL